MGADVPAALAVDRQARGRVARPRTPAKLYYLRERRGKKARIRERRLVKNRLAAIAAAEPNAPRPPPPMPVPPIGPTISDPSDTTGAVVGRRSSDFEPTQPTLRSRVPGAGPGAGRTPAAASTAVWPTEPSETGSWASHTASPLGLEDPSAGSHLEASARREQKRGSFLRELPILLVVARPSRRPQDLRRPGLLHPLGLVEPTLEPGTASRPEGGVRPIAATSSCSRTPGPRPGSRIVGVVRPLVVITLGIERPEHEDSSSG